jgi:SagB-type dehydrogenase family enzyme
MRGLRVSLTLALLVSTSTARAGDAPGPAGVALPPAATDGKVSVEAALKQRRSLRNPASTPLALDDVGQLCWATQGVTDEKGHRAVPSAHATYPLELYVMAGAVNGLAPGLYHYAPAKHSLVLVAGGDARAELVQKAIGQGWIAKAPAIFVIAGAPAKMASMKELGTPFLWVEAGLAAQGFFLEATARGLGSTFVGGFRPAEARAVLGLPAGEEVLAVLPVGRRP